MGETVVASAAEVLAAGPDLPLTAAERARADAFMRPVDRAAWVAARLLTRTLVARHVGGRVGDVRLVQVCERCGGPHGRPRVVGVDGVHVGWSHSDGIVAAVVDDVPCAVDVESLAPLRTRGPTLDAQPGPHRAFAEAWVRRELLVKLGLTDLDHALTVDVTPSYDGRPVLGALLVGVDVGPLDAVAARGVLDPG